MSVTVRQASIADIDALAPLFDAYRRFYRQASDLDLAKRFLAERLERGELVVFLALAQSGEAVGFTQLYPSFSSTRAAPILILNDLFVSPRGRRSGIGAALLAAAADYGRTSGAVELALQTARTNTSAQALYEANGWVRDELYLTYELSLA